MDCLIGEFDNMKISALHKCKLVNDLVKDVTLGPNSSLLDSTENSCRSQPVDSPNPKQKPTSTPKNKNSFKTFTSIVKERSPVGKMLAEIETQIKEEVQSAVQARIEKMKARSREIEATIKLEWVKKQQELIDQAQRQEQLMLKVLEEHDRKAFDHLQQLQLQYQKQAEERHKRNVELQMREKQRQQLLALIEAIHKQQQAFRMLYQEIVANLKCCNNSQSANKILSNHSTKLKNFVESMDKIKDKCKSNTATGVDLEAATNLVKDLTKLKEIIVEDVVSTNRQEEEKAQAIVKQTAVQEEKNALAPPNAKDVTDSNNLVSIQSNPISIQSNPVSIQSNPVSIQSNPVSIQSNLVSIQSNPVSIQANPASIQSNPVSIQSNPVSTQAPKCSVESFVSKNSLKIYLEHKKFLESYQNSYAELLNDSRCKQFRFSCQKAVNIPLNAVSSISSQHLTDKYNRLANLLRGNNVEAGGSYVSASQHPQGIAFCTDLLAKKIVLQGDLMISSTPEASHAFAALLVALWLDFPDFGKLVLAHFHQKVPYLVPINPPKIEGQTDQDYYLSLGYTYVDGVIEKQPKFLKRMSGIMRLYAAVTISKLKRSQQQNSHPHGLAHAWRWLACTLNLEPKMDITATLLFEFLEVTGSAMISAYGTQFYKILQFINDVYLERIRKIDSGGPVSRLEELLQKIKKSGSIEPPKGRLSEGFW